APVTRALRDARQPDGEAAERGLVASGLADKPDDFAGQDRKIDAVDRAHNFLLPMRAEEGADLRCRVERPDEALRRAAKLDQCRTGRKRYRLAQNGVHAARSTRSGWKQRTVCRTAGSPIGSIAGIALHTSVAWAQRSRNAQPSGTARGDGAIPGICARRVPRALIDGTESRSPRVYGWRGRDKTSNTVPCSTIRPAYITQTRSANPAITERSCVIQIIAAPVSRVSFCISNRIWPWIVTSSAVVGSAAESHTVCVRVCVS